MIQTSGISYQYKNGSKLSFPDISINAGQACLLLGDSGSGKTTLLHLIGGLLRAQQGLIQIGGTNIAAMTETDLDRFRAKHLGFVFQRNHLISALSVFQNVLMAPYLAGTNLQRERVEEVLTQLQLTDKRNSKISELSLGQAQRVAIARAVVNKPNLILADEPTSSLDDSNCERAIQLLLSIAQQNQAALLVATHDQRLKRVIPNQVLLQPNQAST